MRTIHKYKVPSHPFHNGFTLKIPQDFEFIKFDKLSNTLGFYLWVEVETEVDDQEYKFYIYRTGWKIPNDFSIVYLGTIIDNDWHLYSDYRE